MVSSIALAPVKDYIDAAGLLTYYVAEGTGEPLVMLHGGFATVETFDGFTPLFADCYRVVSPERRGHGRMPDIPGPITYEIMADDTIAFIDALGIGPVHIVGWSDGGNVAMITAIRRPDLIRKLVVIGTAVTIDGGTPFARVMSEQMTFEHLPPMLVDAYAALSPDGRDHFPVVYDKLSRAIIVTTTQLSDLARISAPVLIMAGDDDLVSIGHLETMRDAIRDAQLAIVPGTSHGLPLEKPELTARLILDFLADEQIPTIMPTRHI